MVRYGENSLAPHITGYIDGDGNGVSGIEKCYNDILFVVFGNSEGKVRRGGFGEIA